MKMFYSCLIESVPSFSLIYWFGSFSLKNRKRLEYIVKLYCKVAGIKLNDLAFLYRVRATQKTERIWAYSTHQLYQLLPSVRRYSLPYCRTKRFKI